MVKICPKLKTHGACSDSACLYRHDIYVCEDCGVICDSTALFQEHLQSKGHQRKAIKLQNGPPPAYIEDGVRRSCVLCGTVVAVGKWPKHLQSQKHRGKEAYSAFKTILEEAEKDKHGVVISDGIDFGIVARSDARKGITIQFTLETTVPTSRIKIDSAKLFSPKASRS